MENERNSRHSVETKILPSIKELLYVIEQISDDFSIGKNSLVHGKCSAIMILYGKIESEKSFIKSF